MEYLIAAVSLVAGWAIAWFFYRRSSADLKRCIAELREDNQVLLAEFRKLRSSINPTDQESLETVQKVLVKFDKYSTAVPGAFRASSACPHCAKPALRFLRYGPGPIGVCNAWFVCDACGNEFQSSEAADD